MSIIYGELSRAISNRNARSIIIGMLFGVLSLVSSLYHSAGDVTLLAESGTIFVGLAAAFVGILGAAAALVFAFVASLLFGASSPLEPLQLIFACVIGISWSAMTRGWVRHNIWSLLALGALLNLALLPAYIWPQQPMVLSVTTATLTSLVINLVTAVLFGSFVERERNMLEAELHLRQLANTDQLTGLHNRRTLIATFDTRVRMMHGQALLLIDVDNFKSVNDAHGHAAGDEVLRHIARHLQAVVRAGDIICRIGGEEFAVLISADSWDEASAAGERLRSEVERHRVRLGQLALQVTVSIGIAWWQGKTTVEEQLSAADEALYRAKRGGRNCIRLAIEQVAKEGALSE